MDSPAQDLRTAGDRIEQLLEELRTTVQPVAYRRAEELLRLVTDLYGAALAHVVELAGASDGARVDQLVDDELIASLLLVHGLHPAVLAERVEDALASVRPFLGQHGGDVELLDIDPDAGAVHLRLLGSCDGCPSSAVTLRSSVERAIVEAAPEIVHIEVDEPAANGVIIEGAAPAPGEAPGAGVPVALVRKPLYDSCPVEVAAP